MSNNSSTDSLVSDIIKYVGDAHWPVSKSELLDWAQKSRATPQVLSALNDMSYDKFYSIDDVTKDYAND